jgi:lecithin:cholesterol acyltransferase
MSVPVVERASRDAVLVIPGIMGSELVESDTGRVLWGLSDPRWYVSAWTSGDALNALRVTEAEQHGEVGRVRATRLLRTPAFAPVLHGAEPYTDLVAAVRRVLAHPDAVREFPYDWRLPVADNARLLADAADAHLARWRAHPEGSRDARLVLVAHSMGGLLARHFTDVLGDGGAVRDTVTLGTPFFGSVKTAHILSSGRSGPLPLPRRRLRGLAVALPGLYDLLPAYRCVDETTNARRLTPADIDNIGGDRAQAERAQDWRAAFGRSGGDRLWAVVGVEQPTMQSLTLSDGVATGHAYTCRPGADGMLVREDRGGDSTVYGDAAAPAGVDPQHLPQKHAALARSPEALAHVRAVITGDRLGPWLAAGPQVGLDVPDVVAAGVPFDITVPTTDDPAVVSGRVVDVATGRQVSRPVFGRRDGVVVATTTLPRIGGYRVEIKGGGFGPVGELVLAVPAGSLTGEDVR